MKFNVKIYPDGSERCKWRGRITAKNLGECLAYVHELVVPGLNLKRRPQVVAKRSDNG